MSAKDDGQLALDAYQVSLGMSSTVADFRDEAVIAIQKFPLTPANVAGLRKRLNQIKNLVARAEASVAEMEKNQ